MHFLLKMPQLFANKNHQKTSHTHEQFRHLSCIIHEHFPFHALNAPTISTRKREQFSTNHYHRRVSCFAGSSALGISCIHFSTIFLQFFLSCAIFSILLVSMFILSKSLCTCLIHVCLCPPLGLLVVLLYSAKAILHGVSSGNLSACPYHLIWLLVTVLFHSSYLIIPFSLSLDNFLGHFMLESEQSSLE